MTATMINRPRSSRTRSSMCSEHAVLELRHSYPVQESIGQTHNIQRVGNPECDIVQPPPLTTFGIDCKARMVPLVSSMCLRPDLITWTRYRVERHEDSSHEKEGNGDVRSIRLPQGSFGSALTWPQVIIRQHQLGIGESRLVGHNCLVEDPF